jgi:chromosome segregation protein
MAIAEAARNQSADILAAAEQKLADTDRTARNLQSEVSSHREERVKHHTAIELGETEQQKLQYDISERLETTPDQLLPISGQSDPADIPDFQSTQNKLERLRRERDNMGPVNLRADIEAEEVEQKLTKQQTDHDELIEATQKLRGAISELNKEGRQRLVDAFGKVNENFSRLFTKLFGGGKAHLAWTEHEDPLEAGLEIFASPPGKKTQILSLLSGGERALTALALLFAVFECNPAPICVLDEVDAPLDENNVHRFCDLLDEMVQHTPTRYLVITHHRMTMSRMHRLFGVTMGEPGVSQLVSVDLQTAEKIRATA